MAVPSVLTDLTISEATNSPPDTETVTPATRPSDYLRALGAILRRPFAQGATVPSLTAANLGSNTDGDYFHISGVTGIAASNFGTVAAGIGRTIVFDGALLLTHNATSFILPGAANITTAAGDVAVFRSEGSGNWKCTNYVKASGAPIGSYQPLDATLTALAGTLTAANKIPYATALDTAGELTFNPSAALGTGTTTSPSESVVKTYADTKTSTASFTGTNQSLVTAGYQKLPGGLIIQWGGQSVAAGTSVTASFPIAFPTGCLRFVAGTAIDGPASFTRNDSTGGIDISATQYTLRQGSGSGAMTITWIAIGN